ncbi:transmembrane protein 205 [Prorops nasuta]|uniref:transmembrane protein 205 n=1 Tax=Prorops nasuta TaxID=863751 RepID=UPI0034CFC073
MCVRTLANQGDSLVPDSKLVRVKEKYIKLHDEMISRELEEVEERRKMDSIYSMPDLANDLLSISTVKYSVLLSALQKYYESVQQTKFFKILFYTAQPAHVIMIAAVLCVTSALMPTTNKVHMAGHPHSRTTSFIYLASFVMHFGAQIWMTFVSGLSLYFALPRHTFGEVQRVLFPRYFTINACLSLITLLIFIKHHPAYTWDSEIAIQVGGMSGAFFLELLIRLYLTPPLLKLIVQKNNLERAAGVGNEIGRHNPGPLKHCPHYLKIHVAFRRVHVCIAMGNMLTMACTVLHLHYLASKLCVL